ALPGIAIDLKASAAAVQLTLPVFFVGLAISQLLLGSLADHFGRRPPLLCGLALIVVGSAGCALAGNASALVMWRLIQALGVGGAGVIPRAVVRDRFDVAHMARAMSLLGLITGIGPILAPQIGGLVLLVANWRFEFWLLSLLSFVCLAVTYFTLSESMPAERPHAIGPRLWISLLKDRRYLRFAIPGNLIQSSLLTYIAGAPFVFIDHFGLSPQQFAWLFGVNAVGLMIAGRINAHIVTRLGAEYIFSRAMLYTAGLGLILLTVAVVGRGGFWALAIPQFFFVASIAFNLANGLSLALTPFGASAGTASALYGTTQFLIAGIGGAAVSALYDGTPRAMAGVICAVTALAAVVYRAMR
ncbi:MAG: multidrug effflux MFS transporter, partial [Pseudomonadota bacterium]|nr:multidrug effflux MFS transporter [Pseudomonadota bacterium]